MANSDVMAPRAQGPANTGSCPSLTVSDRKELYLNLPIIQDKRGQQLQQRQWYGLDNRREFDDENYGVGSVLAKLASQLASNEQSSLKTQFI